MDKTVSVKTTTESRRSADAIGRERRNGTSDDLAGLAAANGILMSSDSKLIVSRTQQIDR